MRVRVLGSAAGGGFPQWNCNCANCAGFRAGSLRASARTQASIALAAEGRGVVLVNASPDVRQQIEASPSLHPRSARRGSPIAAILLTNAEIDHVGGLLSLRESQPFAVYATDRVRQALVEANAMLRAFAPREGRSIWVRVEIGGGPRPIRALDGVDLGLSFEALAVAGKSPGYLHGARSPSDSPEDTVAVRISDARTGGSIVYAPAVKRLDAGLLTAIEGSDVVLFDGTCWLDDELSRHGVGTKSSLDMGHLPIAGPSGSLASLAAFPRVRRIYIHVNNTNPLLDEDSPERRAVERSGIEVAFDGMELDV